MMRNVPRARISISMDVVREVEAIVRWYLRVAYGRWEGVGCPPFFCEPETIGRFAIDLDKLRVRDEQALFQLLVTLSLYQSRRDADVMTIQRRMGRDDATTMTSYRRLRVLIEESRCDLMRAAESFDSSCDVHRDFDRAGLAACGYRPRTVCHVKTATKAIGRMGDMGKLPTSAILHLGPRGINGLIDDAISTIDSPHDRATWLVKRLAEIYRIGLKLASLYVSALSTDELSPGNAVLSPALRGEHIVVVDANVLRLLSVWRRRSRGSKTYGAHAEWIIRVAERIDLARIDRRLPSFSPRFVQQALYVFGSRSNRTVKRDPCAASPCDECPSQTCPFHINEGEIA